MVAVIAATGYALAQITMFQLIGPIALTLLVGMTIGCTRMGRLQSNDTGVLFASRRLLQLGIVMLGSRLQLESLYEIGAMDFINTLICVATTLLLVEIAGRRLGLPRDIRVPMAVGTAICGASAIAATMPILKGDEKKAVTSIAVISLIGILCTTTYIVLALRGVLPEHFLGFMVGGTLQEMGHVLAASSVLSAEAAETALLVKVTRILLLAPVLMGLSWLQRQKHESLKVLSSPSSNPESQRMVSLRWIASLPGFIWGFLALAVVCNLGLIPSEILRVLSGTATGLVVLSMAGIGLRVDFGSIRVLGGPAVLLSIVGFLGLSGAVAFTQIAW